jgi:hypothetical protein
MLIESEDPGFWPALIDWLNKYPAIPNTTTVIRLLSDSKASQNAVCEVCDNDENV